MDRGGAAAPAGVLALSGRQAAGGVRPAAASAADGQRGQRDRTQRSGATKVPGAAARPSFAPNRPLSIQFTNLQKVFWPDDGYTKGDLIEYYRAIAPWLLPYLRDRPLVLTRFPDGIAGKSFFQKDAPGFAPDVDPHRADVERADPARDRLLRLRRRRVAALRRQPRLDPAARLGQPGARRSSDPTGACSISIPRTRRSSNVVQVAQVARQLCEEIELPHLVKTSGSSGLHVLVPLGRQCTYEQSRSLGELLARVISVRAARHRRLSPGRCPAGAAKCISTISRSGLDS